MGTEEQLLASSIRATLNEAETAREKLYRVMEGNTIDNVDSGVHAEALRAAEETLEFYVEKAFRDVRILAERLQLPMYAGEVKDRQRDFKHLNDMQPTPYDVTHYCPALGEVRTLFDSLATMTEGRAVTGIRVFETILENSPNIIEAAGIEPQSEARVREEIRKIMSFSFRDVVREIPIPKIIKTYRPDIGVGSLMAAAEYKFITSKQEAKKCLDEVYADMKGYGGRYDWRSFYAVFYMTGPFYTQKDIDYEFRLVKAELSWKPLVVVGKGQRAKG